MPGDNTHTLAWNDAYYLQTFLLLAEGYSETKARTLIGASEQRWKGWKRRKPALRAAIKKGREWKDNNAQILPDNERPENFHDYVIGHLSPEMRRVWAEIEHLEDAGEEGWTSIKKLLQENGKQFRQSLFVYALTKSRFDMTNAMKKSMINLRTYEKWIKEDEGFRELVREISFHRGNFFENALMNQVQMGDTQAIIFANKTQNKERGYGDSMQVEHTGNIQHTAVQISLDELNLPPESIRSILTTLKQKRLEQHEDDMDAQFTRKE